QRIIELLGAGRGAARRVDVDDDGDVARFLQPLQRLDPLLVAADQAFDVDPRARSRCRERSRPALCRNRADGNDRRDGNQASRDTPEGQLAADPAAIDDHVRIERHRISPEMISAFCIRSVSEALSDYINCDAIRRKQGPASLLPLWEKVPERSGGG